LAGRIFARNFGNKIDPLYLNHLRSSLKKDQIIGYKNDTKFNRQQGLQALKEIEQTLLNPGKDQQTMLNWLQDYIEKL